VKLFSIVLSKYNGRYLNLHPQILKERHTSLFKKTFIAFDLHIETVSKSKKLIFLIIFAHIPSKKLPITSNACLSMTTYPVKVTDGAF
jgi:hypothetical protein